MTIKTQEFDCSLGGGTHQNCLKVGEETKMMMSLFVVNHPSMKIENQKDFDGGRKLHNIGQRANYSQSFIEFVLLQEIRESDGQMLIYRNCGLL